MSIEGFHDWLMHPRNADYRMAWYHSNGNSDVVHKVINAWQRDCIAAAGSTPPSGGIPVEEDGFPHHYILPEEE